LKNAGVTGAFGFWPGVFIYTFQLFPYTLRCIRTGKARGNVVLYCVEAAVPAFDHPFYGRRKIAVHPLRRHILFKALTSGTERAKPPRRMKITAAV